MSAGAQPGFAQDRGHPFQHAALGLGRGGQHLGGGPAAPMLEREVGEGAADIDGEARALHRATCRPFRCRDNPGHHRATTGGGTT